MDLIKIAELTRVDASVLMISNIKEVFGVKAQQTIVWDNTLHKISILRIILPQGFTIKKREYLKITELMMIWDFENVEIKDSNQGIIIELS